MLYNDNYNEIMQMYYSFAIITIVIVLISHWFIFKKAGEEGWKAIIPFYNSYTLCKIVIGNGWPFLICFIPYVNIVFSIYITVMMCKAFGKSTLFKIGAVFLPIIFIPILAFNDDIYIGPDGEQVDVNSTTNKDDGPAYSTTDNGCSTSVKNNPEFKDEENAEESENN